jgi:hypothetical protein
MNSHEIAIIEEHTRALREHTRALQENTHATEENTKVMKALGRRIESIFEDSSSGTMVSAKSILNGIRRLTDAIDNRG